MESPPYLLLLIVLLTHLNGCDISASSSEEEEELNRLYTDEEIDYFTDIGFGSTYGTDYPQRTRKWTKDIQIEVLGYPSAEDLKELDKVIGELNEIIAPIQLHLVDEEPSTKIYFVHPEDYEQYIPNMDNPETYYGYFWISYSMCEIYEATIVISTEVTQKRRSHIIREEVTQSLGITRDSYKYPESIFYQPISEVTEFAPIDKKIIEMLYRPEIKPCMTKWVAMDILKSLEL